MSSVVRTEKDTLWTVEGMGNEIFITENPRIRHDAGKATVTSSRPSLFLFLPLPNGFRGADSPPPATSTEGAEENTGGPGTPVSLTFLGNLYGENKMLALARAYQEATGFHKLRPRLDS